MAMILVHIELFPFHIRQVPPPRFTSPENIDDNVETNTEDNINSRPNQREEPSSQRSMIPVPVLLCKNFKQILKKKVNYL